jgi:hypothetical protein
MMLLSRKEMNVVALAAVVFASITYKIVDQLLALVPVVGAFVDVADGNGCPSTFGFAVHVVVFALAIKYVLPRM